MDQLPDNNIEIAQDAQTVPRRWAVRIWNASIESLSDELNFPMFLNMSFGGSSREQMVEEKSDSCLPFGKGVTTVMCQTGILPQFLRSEVFQLDMKDSVIAIQQEFSFEWRGSYNALDNEFLAVEAWKFRPFTANRKHAQDKRLLKDLATGPVFVSMTLNTVKAAVAAPAADAASPAPAPVAEDPPAAAAAPAPVPAEESVPLLRVKFQIYFQELYDFVLTINMVQTKQWRTDEKEEPEESEGIYGTSDSESETEQPAVVLGGRKSVHVNILSATRGKKMHELLIRTLRNLHLIPAENEGIRSESKRQNSGRCGELRWSNLGTLHYRGSLADLDNDALKLVFYEGDAKIGEGSASLRGVCDYGNVAGQIMPPNQSNSTANGAGIGEFEVRVGVDQIPRTRQTGDLCDMQEGRSYLLVSVGRIDKLATADDTLPISQCDSFVTGTFNGVSFSTTTIQDSLAPEFKQEFYFELPANLNWASASIVFDVWLDREYQGCEPCGSCAVGLLEIARTGKRELRAYQTLRTGEVEQYETQVLRVKKQLDKAGESHLYLECWFKPLQPVAAIAAVKAAESTDAGPTQTLPKRVQDEWDERVRIWGEQCGGAQAACPYAGVCEKTGRTYLLSSFIDTLRPPEALATREAVAFWVHTIRTVAAPADTKQTPSVASPDFVLTTLRGDMLSKSVLLCSLLLGTPRTRNARKEDNECAFVCVGRLWDDSRAAWTAVFELDGSVTLLDPVRHDRWTLPGRFADLGRARRVVTGRRRMGRLVKEEAVTVENMRRKNLIVQEAQSDTSGKDSFAGDQLYLIDEELHPHVLKYTSLVPETATCSFCQEPFNKKRLFGYVCVGGIVDDETDEIGKVDSQPCDPDVFVCFDCGQASFDATGVQLTDADLYWSGPASAATADGRLRPVRFGEEPIVPFKSIEVIFNNTNCWMNLQHASPVCIFYDLWNPLYWMSFLTASTTPLPACFSTGRLTGKRPGHDWFDRMTIIVQEKTQKAIEQLRVGELNVAMVWQRDAQLVEFLEDALKVRAEMEFLPLTRRQAFMAHLNECRRAIYSKIPQNCRFEGRTLCLVHFEPQNIKRKLLEKLPLIQSKEANVQFTLAVHVVRSLPGPQLVAFVYVGVLFSLDRMRVDQVVTDRAEHYGDSHEPLDLLFDESLESISQNKWLLDTASLADLQNANGNIDDFNLGSQGSQASLGDAAANLKRSKTRGSVKGRGADARTKNDRKQPGQSGDKMGNPEGEISDYIKSMVDGRTKFVTRKRERRVLDEKIFVLHHESGQDILLPTPAEMRELQVLSGGKGLEKIQVGKTTKKTVILKEGITAESVLKRGPDSPKRV